MEKIIAVTAIFLCFFSFEGNAQKGKILKQHALHRVMAKKVIRRTAVVLVYARNQVKQNKVFTGDLARAVRHQRFARVLFREGKFARAIHQSRRARKLAFLAITANKGTINKDWELSDNDNIRNDKTPDDDELDKELPEEKVTDEDLINSELTDIDLSDSE